jgi:hypothetical protein
MLEHGIDNVRGGSYSNVNLTEQQRDSLTKELRTAQNACFKCGRKGHFAKDCYAKTDVDGKSLFKKPKKYESPDVSSGNDSSEDDSSDDDSSEDSTTILKSFLNGIVSIFQDTPSKQPDTKNQEIDKKNQEIDKKSQEVDKKVQEIDKKNQEKNHIYRESDEWVFL